MSRVKLMGMEKARQNTLIIFFVFSIIFFAIQNTVFGEENFLEPNLQQVIIKDSEQGLYPEYIEIGKGDTVIWYNQGPPMVRVRFLTALGIVCSPIINFNGDMDGIFLSDEIPQGGIASLCLIEEGMYEYEVVRLIKEDQKVRKGNIMQGKVIVE